MRSYAAFNHRDANHANIVADLKKQGVKVEEILQPLDLFCWLSVTGYWGFVEIKVPGCKAKWKRKQLKFLASTPFPVCIVTDAAQAMEFLKTGKGLSQAEKDRLAVFLIRNKGRTFTPAQITKVLTNTDD